MGGKKKKSNNGPIKKESKYKIPSRFDCPLCDAKSSIAVKVSRATNEASLHCRQCKIGEGERFMIRPLEKAVDVFFRFRESLLRLDRQRAELQGGLGVADSAAQTQLAGGRAVKIGRSLADLDARQRPPQSDDDEGLHHFEPREEMMDEIEENPEYGALFD